jgi:2-polyprenyl-3-methyl-5-hydroxy-6-metoxy-1,4-benzoquinol methylase
MDGSVDNWGMSNTLNADPAELAKFSDLAHLWWDKDSDTRTVRALATRLFSPSLRNRRANALPRLAMINTSTRTMNIFATVVLSVKVFHDYAASHH